MGKRQKRKHRRKPADDRERSPPAAPPARRRLPKWKFALFSLLPALLLLLVAEGVVRLAGLARPALRTMALPEEAAGLFRPDRDLFWSLRPHLHTTYAGARVTSNSLGLRSPEVQPKRAGEFRILSLGESSTFGVGVANDQTYTALLPQQLSALAPGRTYTAFNAGVSAYSSFQSLIYLEKRGLQLQPDLVLFYHEVNDYLPSALRDSSHTELGVVKTDMELYQSRVQSMYRWLLDRSALVRFLSSRYAYRSIRAFNRDDFENPLFNIGLPDLEIPGRLQRIESNRRVEMQLNEKSLGQRVSESERREILGRLDSLCRARSVELVVIHPAYRDSAKHTCLLTRFCQEHNVLMYEAFDALHPPERTPGEMYHDFWHPSVMGHARLAESLARFLAGTVLAAPPPGESPLAAVVLSR